MRTALLCLCLMGCATVRTAEGEKELIRDAIHWRHTQCYRWAESPSWRGADTFRLITCDREEKAACIAAGLEPMCGEWQWGGT